MLIAKRDDILKNHIDSCIAKSEERHSSKLRPKGKYGRGNAVTLISKNTVNSVIRVISDLNKNAISQEVSEAKMYSVQIDTTQDVTSQDQCSIVLRYVHGDRVLERLLAVVKCDDSTGQGFKNLVLEVLSANKINLKYCIGASTDGAANMLGEYNGFYARLLEEVPWLVHVWCYAHVLNLVMVDTVGTTVSCISLFGPLNKIAVFIRKWYNRMEVWTLMML